MKFYYIIFFLINIFITNLIGQGQVIKLKNPSFESIPAAGSNFGFVLPGWGDCAPYYFRDETAPDIHGNDSKIFAVTTKPQEGSSYVGMVTRATSETWEMIAQKLESVLIADKCYEFKINLAKSDIYLSGVDKKDSTKYNFNKPIKLRIWGSSSPCEKTQMLAESAPVNHSDWKEYTFRFKPNRHFSYILLEAFYKTPVLTPYNGNILLDNASDIVEIPCPGEEILAKVDINEPSVIEVDSSEEIVAIKNKPKKTKPKKTKKTPKKTIAKETKKKKTKILVDLDKKTIARGQIIKIERLYFDADSSNFKSTSNEVLEEIYEFLVKNPKVIIEIGGHTNNLPKDSYCNRLSANRAKNVAKYLYKRGIPKYRIKYKGYGKSKPIANNKTKSGRQRNQRVEIKILRAG